MTEAVDIAVIGAGLTGATLAYGLSRRGARIALFDPVEDDLHASAGNFGLVWVQGKGLGAPAYEALTRRSAAAWSAFAEELAAETGHDPDYRQSGGIKIALSHEELDVSRAALHRMHNQDGGRDTAVLSGNELRKRVPAVGPEAVGGVFCPSDGHVDPLATRTALSIALLRSQHVSVVRARASRISPDGKGFAIHTVSGTVRAEKVVIAAGLGASALAADLGLHVPLRPQRGQILVTERLQPFLDVACHTVRQTKEGTVLIGDTKEEVGFDRGTTRKAAMVMAARAARMFPALKSARIVRQWGALRVMSPDGLPIYAQSPTHPGAMALTCHSGVTLAAAHAGEVAEAVLSGMLSERYPAFSPARFERTAA